MNKDIFTLLSGFLTAVLLFLGTIGIKIDWFTQESIDAFVFMVAAFVTLIVNLYAIWKNTYVSKKARKQKEVLKQKGLL
jgi:SPP1 family holin